MTDRLRHLDPTALVGIFTRLDDPNVRVFTFFISPNYFALDLVVSPLKSLILRVISQIGAV
jgi:hypothetical protein